MNWKDVAYAVLTLIVCLAVIWITIPVLAFMLSLALKIVILVLAS